ncbi:MAG: rhodanese-like domain-containing protein [Parcubacteria group bacterium]
MQNKSKNNAIALSIGFFLIIMIALVTIFHPFSAKNDSDAKNASQHDSAAEKLNASPKISSGELAKKIQRKEKLMLIDIRSKTEYDQEHLLDSQNIPLADIDEALKIMDRHAAYVLIGADSISEPIAETLGVLSDSGFEKISYLAGGFSDWKSNYYPTISEGDPNRFTDQSKVSYIQTDALKEMIGSGTGFTIIDVRKNSQFNEEHLEGAINIFLDDLEKRKNDIPLGKKIILYDNDGLWAFKAAVKLFDMGFFNTFALSDGLDSWKKKGYATVK